MSSKQSTHGGGNGDKQSVRAATKSRKSQAVSTVQPEVVTLQKDQLQLLLAKCHKQETKLKAFENLQLVIQDAFSQVTKEKAKSVQFQTALISTEARLTELLQAQIESSPSLQQLPFLNRSGSQQERPVGKAACFTSLPSTSHPGTDHTASSDSLKEDDIEIDGPAESIVSQSSGYPTSGYGTSECSLRSSGSLVTDGPHQDKPQPHEGTQKSSSPVHLSINEYENIIQKQSLSIAQLKLHIQTLERLLEAKTNGNTDALSQQLTQALRKIDELKLSMKHKDTLLQNYYTAYNAMAAKQSKPSTMTSDPTDLDDLSIDDLKTMIHKLRREGSEVAEKHQTEVLHQRGLYLKEKETVHDLQTKLQSAEQTLEESRARPHTLDSDYPFTMAELREKTKYAEDTVKLLQKNTIKLSEEKEMSIARCKMVSSELEKLKKERTEVESQMKQLREKHLQEQETMRTQLTLKKEEGSEKAKKLEQELNSVKSKFHQLQSRFGKLQHHTAGQQELISSLQGLAPDTSSMPYQHPQQMPRRAGSDYAGRSSSAAGGGGSSVGGGDVSALSGGGKDDDEVLECPRCLKEYSLEQVEKFQQHCVKCTD